MKIVRWLYSGKRVGMFLVVSRDIFDFGFMYERDPAYGQHNITHQFRLGLIWLRFYFEIRAKTTA
jgi:hypothetical protein